MLPKNVFKSVLFACLLLGMASLLGASEKSIGALPLAPVLTFEAQSGIRCEAAGGSNCDTDADCPSGSYCYHDPLAFVPYCVSGSVEQLEL